MAAMKVLNSNDKNFANEFGQLRTKLHLAGLLESAQDQLDVVLSIIRQVRQDGDLALCRLTKKFDDADLTPSSLKVAPRLLKQAADQLDRDLLLAARQAIDNVKRYQRHILVRQDQPLRAGGACLTTRWGALERVGICVPGASAPLVSTLIMSVAPAQAAGVKQIAVVCPPRFKGQVHPAIMGVCHELGIDELYAVGGAQAVAALAYGTETIRPVDKIVGPGNIYVQLAKKEVFGLVDIDSFAGPSEIVVLADQEANQDFVACDLMGQAEHDPGSGVLITTSQALAQQVLVALERELAASSRGAQTARCLNQYGAIIITNDIDQAIDLVNQLAPEHLSIQTAQPQQVAFRCINAGAIFIGKWTSEAVGDYIAGPSHVLPTAGTARFFSPLSSMDFVRHSSLIEYDRAALEQSWPAIKALTDIEGLPAHARSVEVRLASSKEDQ